MGSIRDAKRTRQRILDAGAKEFTQKGFDAATVAAVALRAGVSKQLITHHFSTKENLFEKVLDLKYRPLLDARETMPGAAYDLIADRFLQRASYVDYIRFLTWEAANGRTASMPALIGRKRRIAGYSAALREMQVAGKLPAEFDHALIQLLILSLSTYPIAFGQMTRLVTGMEAGDPRFKRKWYQFLRLAGKRLFDTGPDQKPRSRKRNKPLLRPAR